MTINIFCSEDIINALRATLGAHETTAICVLDLATGGVSEYSVEIAKAYGQGFRDALASVALAFGIKPEDITNGQGPPAMQIETIEGALRIPRVKEV